jgi:hypothetical protein
LELLAEEIGRRAAHQSGEEEVEVLADERGGKGARTSPLPIASQSDAPRAPAARASVKKVGVRNSRPAARGSGSAPTSV